MFSAKTATFATVSLLLCTCPLVNALCIREPAFAPFPQASAARKCSNSPSDTSNLEVYLVFSGACEQHATWYNSLAYWGRDGKRSTAHALDTYTLAEGTTSGTMTFHLPVPITALAPGRVANAGGYAQDTENWRRLDWYVDWVQEFVESVVYVSAVQTVPVFETVTERTFGSLCPSLALLSLWCLLLDCH
jgi:hypothetical protein